MNLNLETVWIDYRIERGLIRGPMKQHIGLKITIRARPEIEEFMQNISKNRKVGIDAYGDGWVSCDLDNPLLEVYTLETDWRCNGYILTAIAQPPLIPDEIRSAGIPVRNAGLNELRAMGGNGSNTNMIPNLSFLTLAGISNPEGLAIGITGAYSSDYIIQLRQLLPKASKQFLEDFIVPVTISLQIVNRG